jgi:hypothetical protein
MLNLVVLFVGGKPKGVMSETSFNNLHSHRWWDYETWLYNVEQRDWEKTTITNVESLIQKYRG